MRQFAAFAAAAAIVASTTAALAAGPTFKTIDNPADPTFNQLLGINNLGVISGYFGSGMAGHPNKGYTIAPPYTSFVPANLPDSAQTQATGINAAGTISGFWAPTNTGTDANYGFIRFKDHTNFIYYSVNDPLAASSPPVNQVLGVNNKDIAVGFYLDGAVPTPAPHGFVYNAVSATLLPFNIGGSVSDAATGINNNNEISGFYTDAKGVTHGFLKPLTGGVAVRFTVPGATTTQFLGVNDNGMAVGFYIGTDTFPHGITFNPANAQWVEVNDPNGAMGTTLNGINDKGEIVGFYTDAAGNTHGMLVTGVK